MLRSQASIEFDPGGVVLNADPPFLEVMGYRLDESGQVRQRHHRGRRAAQAVGAAVVGRCGTDNSVVAETNAMGSQKSLVLGGHGLTILPAIADADELSRGLISAAPLREPQAN